MPLVFLTSFVCTHSYHSDSQFITIFSVNHEPPAQEAAVHHSPAQQAGNILGNQISLDLAYTDSRRVISQLHARLTHCCQDVANEFERRQTNLHNQLDDLRGRYDTLFDRMSVMSELYEEAKARLERVSQLAKPLADELARLNQS